VTPDGDASKHNAVGLMGLNTGASSNNSDSTLCVGGGISATARRGGVQCLPADAYSEPYAAGASNPSSRSCAGFLVGGEHGLDAGAVHSDLRIRFPGVGSYSS